MIIRALKIVIQTNDGAYGNNIDFSPGLNVIRGDNTSGKSTIVSSLIFALGMEELLGGKSENVLQSALKSHLTNSEGRIIQVISSYVLLEVENKRGEIAAFKRAITTQGDRTSKLIEVYRGAALTQPNEKYESEFRYIHDPGSAQSEEGGFFWYLEKFLSLDLPSVATVNGEAKLYLQTLFAAMIIEQKSGWTDYIANIPYFRIRNASQKVFEYLLGFSTFENDRKRTEVKLKLSEITKKWEYLQANIAGIKSRNSIEIRGVPTYLDEAFDSSQNINFFRNSAGNITSETQFFIETNEALDKLSDDAKNLIRDGHINPAEYDAICDEMRKLAIAYETVAQTISTHKSEIDSFRTSIDEISKDLEKNKVAKKLHDIGGELNVSALRGACPICNQSVNEFMISDESLHIMSIEDNIGYLNSQKKMLEKCVSANKASIEKLTSQQQQVAKLMNTKREILSSIRRDMVSNTSVSESLIRKKIDFEREMKDFLASKQEVLELVEEVKLVTTEWIHWNGIKKNLPKGYLSDDDIGTLKNFKDQFVHLARTFGFTSINPKDIDIDDSKYIPIIANDTLRHEIKNASSFDSYKSTSVKNDASASDFVRLIWAYVISLNKCSHSSDGNHPGLILLDEPAQHSMAVSSQKALIKELSKMNTQTIIAASFDNSDDVFNQVVGDTKIHLIRIKEKSISKC